MFDGNVTHSLSVVRSSRLAGAGDDLPGTLRARVYPSCGDMAIDDHRVDSRRIGVRMAELATLRDAVPVEDHEVRPIPGPDQPPIPEPQP
jgi:hypothetical protein